MPAYKNGVQTPSVKPSRPLPRVRLTEREQRWADEFASEGVHIVRTTPLPTSPAGAGPQSTKR
jgi:hypothetical protein